MTWPLQLSPTYKQGGSWRYWMTWQNEQEWNSNPESQKAWSAEMGRWRSKVSVFEKRIDEWLRKIEGSGLPGNFKAWLFQHGLLPRLAWLLMISKAPMTSVEGMERRANKHFRKCFGVPPRFISVGLYIQSSQLQPTPVNSGGRVQSTGP